ncbi:MAG: patatin-like phospholipase family protein [Bacteroidaceae bacterium]|nr:patatin-like phospholipase family protein [Bacteroidaceae bacterium]
MKKQKLPILLLLLFLVNTSITADNELGRKKVAVVFSGGGAKGMADIGALKVIEEAGIPIDYIVGTSMGAIVGGLYSIGYRAHQLDSLVRKQDWNFLLTDRVKPSDMSLAERERSEKYLLSASFVKNPSEIARGGLIKGKNLGNLFSNLTIGYHDSIDFNELPIPFACVSCNVVNGDMVVFHNGNLATAMRSSMAIPGIFTPVRINGMVLVDGGMIDNYPVDVAKAMGADYVIGIDVKSNMKKADELKTAGDILGQIVDIACQGNYQKNVDMTDTYIKVNVKGYSSASFSLEAIDTLINRGEKAARAKWSSLMELKEKIGLAPDYQPNKHSSYICVKDTQKIYVDSITFSGISNIDKIWLIKKCNLKQHTDISITQINQAMNMLRGVKSYLDANYKLIETENGYHLNFLLVERKDKNINLGARFDSEEIASMILNMNTIFRIGLPATLSVTGRLGKRYSARMDCNIQPLEGNKINLSYEFQHNEIDIYNKGDHSYSSTYNYHECEFGFSDVWFKNWCYGLGVKYEYFNYQDFLYRNKDIELDPGSEHYFSYYAKLEFNSLNKINFPSKGHNVSAYYAVCPPKLFRLKNPFSVLNASWETVIPLSYRFSILPSIYGRALLGHNIAYSSLNVIGGNIFGQYCPQELPFSGINRSEIIDNSIVISSIKLRQRMGSIHYITLNIDYAMMDSHFLDILKGESFFGSSIGYGMDSVFGPLEFIMGYSGRTKKVGVYINIGYYF